MFERKFIVAASNETLLDFKSEKNREGYVNKLIEQKKPYILIDVHKNGYVVKNPFTIVPKEGYKIENFRTFNEVSTYCRAFLW